MQGIMYAVGFNDHARITGGVISYIVRNRSRAWCRMCRRSDEQGRFSKASEDLI
jgi:alkylated DNA nucleotide flippase Atl1